MAEPHLKLGAHAASGKFPDLSARRLPKRMKPSRRPLRALASIAIALPVLSGCASMERFLANLDKPSAEIEGVRLASVDLTGADLIFDVSVSNPYSVALPIHEIRYSLGSQGKAFLTGQIEPDRKIEAEQTQTVTVPANVSFAGLLDLVDGISPGSMIPYEGALDFGFQLPGGERFSLPLRHQGELPFPRAPKISLQSLSWKELSLQEATAELELRLQNPNRFPIGLDRMLLKLALGGTQITTAEVKEALEVAPDETVTLQIPISVTPSKLGLATLNSLRSGRSSYDLSGEIRLTLPPKIPLILPMDYSGELPLSMN